MSDEERLRRGEMRRDATAVEVAEGQIVATVGMSARKAAEKWWQENVPEPVFYDTEVGEVEINSKSIEDSLAHRYGQAKLDAITSLVEGFENAVYLGSMQDFVRQEGVVNHYFAYPITYKGERSYVFCRAMQDANKNRLYVHEVFVADKIKKGNTLQTAASQPHGGIALYRDILANVLDRSTSFESKVTNNTDTKQENEEKSAGGEKEPMSPTPAMIDRMIEEQRVDDVSELLISSELKKAAEGIAEAFGMKVVYLKKVFIKSDDPAVEDFEGNGFVRNGVIYLSLKEANIAQFTFGHELLHQLKQIDPDSYMRIRQKVIDVMGRKAFEMEVKARQMTYANVPGYTLFEDYAEEVIADTLGDIITHTDMLPNIARSLKDNPSLLDRFLNVVDNVRQYFRGKIGGALGDLVNDIRNTYEMTARQGAERDKFSLRLAVAKNNTDKNPSQAQKESGNYRKGHIRFGGYNYTIENPQGSYRSGVDENGKKWKQKMNNTYGYILGTKGKDGDHLDMFINDKADLDSWNGNVYVVDQVLPDGSFDEHKVMYGFDSEEEARKAYLSNYEQGWQGLGNITGVSKEDFDRWLEKSGRKTKAFSEYSSVKKETEGNKPSEASLSLSTPLTDEEVVAITDVMKANATVAPTVEINDANWKESVDTPIGAVKMGENQKAKLFAKGREQQYGMLLETLSNPDVVLEEKDKEQNMFHERPSSYLFVKTFQKEDGSKYVHFESVTVSQEGMEVSISSHIIRENQLKNKLKSDRLLYKATALDAPANTSAEQPIVGGSLSSDGKDTEKVSSGQEDGEKSVLSDLEREFQKALEHEEDVEQKWEDKIQDYVAEHYPTQVTVSAATTSAKGVQEREAMKSDHVLRAMREKADAEYKEARDATFAAQKKMETAKESDGKDRQRYASLGVSRSLGEEAAEGEPRYASLGLSEQQLAERQEVNGGTTLFSLKNDRTLAGVHNITEEKLLKALKQGGLANPSVAVIDSSKQNHDDYGDISLILPSDKVAKRTGKNAGTWQGDAWTPTYPQVERQMSNKGAEKASNDVSSVPSDMYSEVRRGLDRWLDGGEENSAMAYMFLHEKGVAPEPKKIQPKFSDEAYNELKSITAGNFNIYGIGKADAQKVLDMYIDAKFDGDKDLYEEKTKAWLERNKSIVDAGANGGMRYDIAKENVELYDEYGFNYKGVQTFVRDVEYDHRKTGVDMNATLNEVEDYIKTNNLTDEFNTWMEGKEKEYGIKEVIFDGFTPSGNRRYVPNTLENVSKIMKKQGRNGSTGISVSFQNFAARLMPSYGTLKDIRSKKGLLTSDREKLDKFREKWSNVFFELGMKCQPDATGTFDDYGLARLSEAAMASDPQAYLKKEYNVDFSDEDTKRLKEMVKAIKEESPAMYFETKFERPVGFDEFSSAVVPTTASNEVKQALQNAGVQIYEYDKEKEGDRSRAFNEAINSSDNIRFSLDKDKGTVVSPSKPSKAEAVLRDAVIDRLRENGMEVITDVAEGQRVLDEANGKGKLQMGDAPETFAERQKLAVENRGVVMPGLNETYVEVVKDIPRHGYTGTIAEATKQAIQKAKEKYVPEGKVKVLHYDNNGAEFDYVISGNAIEICLSPKHQAKSGNKGVHLALAEHLDEVINKSVEVEEHPDYIKGKDGKRGEYINPNAIMHRFYGVAIIDGVPCRIMTLMREDARSEESNGIHSYEVQKIEMLDNELPSISNGVGTQINELSAYPLAKLLKGVEKAYDKGKYLLEESEKRSAGLREQRMGGADGLRFFRTANGEAYGFTVGGKIYVDPRIATSETPVHEYAHLWASALRNGNKEEWQNVVGLMKDSKVWDEVKKRYPELKTDDEIADEVIATYSGRRGAERLREEQRKIAEGNGGVFEKAEAISALEHVKRALKMFWKGVADFLHIHYKSAEEVADRVMKDLLEGVDPRKMGDGVDRQRYASLGVSRALGKEAAEGEPRYQFIGEKGAAEADHAEEVSVRLDNLSVAREMEAEKKDAKAIKMATGWERGADGKWRYEIADLKEFDRNGNLLYRKHHPDYARYIELQDKDLKNLLEDGEELTDKEREEYEALSKKYESDKFGGEKLDNIHTLEAYVDAPELFKAYPELRNVRVTFKDTGGWETASYYAISDAIDFNVDDVGEIVVNTGKVTANMRTKELKSVFLHEIQHAIQVIEGFAEGGSPQYMKGLYSDYFLQDYSSSQLHELAELRRIAEGKVKRGEYKRMSYAVKNVIKAAKEHGFYPTWAESFDNNPNSVTTVYDTLVKFPSEILDKAVLIDERDLYNRVAGEVEARNVQERMGMSAEERRASLAAETEDVAREDQIFLMGDGVSNQQTLRNVNNQSLFDAIHTLYSKGKAFASQLFNMKFFDVAETPDFMKRLGLTGDKFTVRYGVLSRHFGKDGSHDFTEAEWNNLPKALKNPFAIAKVSGKKNAYRIYTSLRTSKGEYVVVGVDVKNAGRNLEVNSIATIFGRRNSANLPINEELLYTSKEITPEQMSLLSQPNSDQYPSDQELSDANVDNSSETAKESEGKDRQRYASIGVSRSLGEEAAEGEPRWASWSLSEPRGEREQRAANERFNNELTRYQNGEMDKNEMLHLGRPQGVMRAFLPNLPIVMRQRILTKGSVKKHNVAVEALVDMPNHLSHPIFVFKRSDNVLGVLTEMQDRDGKNVCVAIELNRQIQNGGEILEVNDIRSVHGRNVADIVYPIVQNGTLKWVDKEKGLTYLSSASQYVRQEIDKQDLDTATKVVKDFVNPKESEGKDRQRYASIGVSRSLGEEAAEGEPRWASLGLSEQQLDGDDTIRFSLNYDKWDSEMASWLKRNPFV